MNDPDVSTHERERGRGRGQSQLSARVVRLPSPPRESPLMPTDFDRALQRMKTDLALTALKRQLLDPRLRGREVLEIVEQIESLENA